MRLKVLTTTLLLAGIVMLFGWPIFMRAKPVPSAPLRTRQLFVIKSGAYFLVMVSDFVIVAGLSLIMLRRSREEYRDHAMANLTQLIEESLNDGRPSE